MQKNNLFCHVFFIALCLFLVACCGSSKKAVEEERYVVVLSMDGFRPDYLQKAQTPNIDSIIRVGISSELIPCFPTLTFPNHYSMATGLYPDKHGLVSNTFWERETGRSYSIGNRKAVNDPYFYGGEPLWNTVKKEGLRSACFFWVGSDVAVGGEYAHYWKKYNGKVPYENRVDTVIAWLKLPKKERPNLIMWYLDEPDHAGHSFTPDSEKTYKAVERCDRALGYFLAEMRKLPHADKIDFLLVSDHGMSTYRPELSVNLSHYLPRDSFQFVAPGVPCQLYTTDTYRETAYQILKGVPRVEVYKKEELPERLHYGKNPRVGDLVVIPEIGTYIYFQEKAKLKTGGMHGYDNKELEMRALFCAFGPSFERGVKHEAFDNINIYPLVCRLLGISPSENDADEKIVDKLLRKRK